MIPEDLCRLRRLLGGLHPDTSKERLIQKEIAEGIIHMLSANCGFTAYVLRDYIRAKAYLLFLEENPRGCERRWMKYDELAAGYEERVWEELAMVLADETGNEK